MRIARLQMKPLEIPFRTSFKHASAERAKAASIWVEATAENKSSVGHGEACPREYVTGESVESAIKWFAAHRSAIMSEISDLQTLMSWVEEHALAIDHDPASWCAVELALLDLLGKEANQTVESLLMLPALAGAFQYSAVLGDALAEVFRHQANKYLKTGFRDFKLKLSGDPGRDREKIACLHEAGLPLRIRADANNLWTQPREAVDHLERLGNPFWAIEEPLAPRDYEGLAAVANALGVRIILDESMTRLQDLHRIAAMPEPWVLNLRVSKLGGVIRSLGIIEQAHARGMDLIVGAHVGETSLLARAGLLLAAAAGDALVAMEGGFGTHLLEHDVCEPPLMFGEGGLLHPQDWRLSEKSGWGLEPQSVG